MTNVGDVIESACPACELVAERRVYDIGSGPELSCVNCEWCWGADGQSLKPLMPEAEVAEAVMSWWVLVNAAEARVAADCARVGVDFDEDDVRLGAAAVLAIVADVVIKDGDEDAMHRLRDAFIQAAEKVAATPEGRP